MVKVKIELNEIESEPDNIVTCEVNIPPMDYNITDAIGAIRQCLLGCGYTENTINKYITEL